MAASVLSYLRSQSTPMRFIKSTDHRRNDNRPTDPPTHRPKIHRPTEQDSISNTSQLKDIYFAEFKRSWENVKLWVGLFELLSLKLP